MASWSKVRQQLQGFLSPDLVDRVEYRASSYRYASDRAGTSYMAVDKNEVFMMKDMKFQIRWYETEQEVMHDYQDNIRVTQQEIDEFQKKEGDKIPQERIPVILRKRKSAQIAKDILREQTILSKSNFFDVVNIFLSSSVDSSLNSEHILLNILAIVDRRVGKSRLRKMEQQIQEKHPIVQYFYHLRCGR